MNQTATEKFEVAIASLGGQGSLLLGKLLAEAGLTVYKNVTYFPNYGAAMRGGSSFMTPPAPPMPNLISGKPNWAPDEAMRISVSNIM